MANEAPALARQIGAPALIATGLSAVSLAVARTGPGQARARPCESRELSTALGYQSPSTLLAATIAFLVGDQAAMLELGVRMRPQARTAAGVQISVAVHHQQARPAQTIQDRAAGGSSRR